MPRQHELRLQVHNGDCPGCGLVRWKLLNLNLKVKNIYFAVLFFISLLFPLALIFLLFLFPLPLINYKLIELSGALRN